MVAKQSKTEIVFRKVGWLEGGLKLLLK